MQARGKAFEAVDGFADNEPDWGDVDKTKLPRACFLDPGEPDKKSSWRYPYKWVQGGGGSDDNGVYTSGTIRPHRGAINAAWAAANGAHTGKRDAAMVSKLAAIRKRYGLGCEGKDGGQLDFGPGIAGAAGHIHGHEVHPMAPPWEDVDEESLPNVAFADPEKRRYAHHHVVGATQQDADGRCKDGKMYLHAAGAKCAFGKALEDGASEQVIQHLATHAFNLAEPEYTAPQGTPGSAPLQSGTLHAAAPAQSGVMGEGSHETGAPQFGPGGKADGCMRPGGPGTKGKTRTGSLAKPTAACDRAGICYKDVVLAELEAPEVATGAGYIEGYAAIFGNVDSQGEIIRKGAFAKTIRERIPAGKVKLMTLHLSKGGSTQQVIGTVTGAREDDRGLWIHAEFASDPDSQAARAKAAEGHVRGLSIGYYPLSKVETLVDGEVAMELNEIKLLEVTLTPFPANELAEVTSAKSMDVNSPQPAIPHGAGPATADWGSAIARRKLALARLELEG